MAVSGCVDLTMDLDVPCGAGTEAALQALSDLGWAVAGISWTVDAEKALRAAAESRQESLQNQNQRLKNSKAKSQLRSDESMDLGGDSDMEDMSDEDGGRTRGPSSKSISMQLPPPDRFEELAGSFPAKDYFARRRQYEQGEAEEDEEDDGGDGDGTSEENAENPQKRGEDAEPQLERYTRLTIEFHGLPGLDYVLRHPFTALFDVVVLRISTARAFDSIMQIIRNTQDTAFDAIQVPLTLDDKLPFRLGPPEMRDLRQAQVFVEINYLEALPISGARIEQRHRALTNGRAALEHVSGGGIPSNSNVIFSSGTMREDLLQLRAPEQVIAIATTLGLSKRQAQCAITTNGEALLERARQRRARIR